VDRINHSVDLTVQSMRGIIQSSKSVEGKKRITIYSGLMLVMENIRVPTRQDFSWNKAEKISIRNDVVKTALQA